MIITIGLLGIATAALAASVILRNDTHRLLASIAALVVTTAMLAINSQDDMATVITMWLSLIISIWFVADDTVKLLRRPQSR